MNTVKRIGKKMQSRREWSKESKIEKILSGLAQFFGLKTRHLESTTAGMALKKKYLEFLSPPKAARSNTLPMTQ